MQRCDDADLPADNPRGRRLGRDGGRRGRSGFGRRSAGSAPADEASADRAGPEVEIHTDDDGTLDTVRQNDDVLRLPPPREPQQDRSRITRRRLLDASVDSLAQVGWTATSVAIVAGRAGVSRGAAQHHFPTRESLFEAVTDYITEQRMAELARGADNLPAGRGRTEAVLELLVASYVGPLFRAALQIWTAASSEDSLRARITPLEAELGRRSHAVAVELLGVDESRAGAREIVQGTLDMARGLGLADVLSDDSRRRRRVIAQWAVLLDQLLAEPG